MYFIYNNTDSRDIGLKVKNIPYDIMAKKRFTELVLERYDGTIYRDENTFDSYTIDIECVMLDNFTVSNISDIKNLFKSGKGELILSHKPDLIYKVVLTNTLNFVELLKHTGSCILSFKVEPFGIIATGRNYVNVSNGGVLTNIGNYFSKPTYKVEGVGNCTITVNDKEMKFINVTGNFFVDTELEDIYGAKGENFNNFMTLDSDFQVLQEGDNIIKYSGSGFKISIMPNWRVL